MKFVIGIVCVGLGLVVRLIALKKLGGDFSMFLKVPSRIETGGLYKYSRHPLYFGSLLMVLGLSLIEPVAGIMYTGLGVAIDRIGREETILNIKPEYKEYQKKTSMLFPWFTWWRKKDA